MAVRVTREITTRIEGPLQETINCVAPQAPSLDDLLCSMRNLCFVVETVAHLLGKEEQLLPIAELARKQIAALAPIEVP